MSQPLVFCFLICRMWLYGDLNGMNMFLTFAIKQAVPKPVTHDKNNFSQSSHKPDSSRKLKDKTN